MPRMTMKKCPVCGVSVKIENLEKHVKSQHPRENIDLRSRLSDVEKARVKQAKSSSVPRFRAKNLWPLAAIAIVLVLVLVVTLMRPGAVGISVGQTAPDINLPNTDGGTTRLYDLRGRPTLLEFMDVDCGHCQSEADVLSVVYQHRADAANFFSIDVNFVGSPDDATRINPFRESHHTPWPYSLDSDGSVTKTYGVDGTPRTFILDRNGVVSRILSGEVAGGNATYEAAIDYVS